MSISRRCNVCEDILMDNETEHSDEVCKMWQKMNLSMKPLLGLAVQEAVKLAIIDSVIIPDEDGDRYPSDQEREQWKMDIYSMPRGCLETMDPGALAQNVSVRLLGGGGWFANGVYTGNASPREIMEACIQRPDEDPNAEHEMMMKEVMDQAGIEGEVTTDLATIEGWISDDEED